MIHIIWQERGQGLVEYALILVLVAIVVIVGLNLFGSSVLGLCSQVEAQMALFS
jgi:pilus assembly protein Flp/PilA